MSLRPNERTEVRRNRYKVAVDAEEGRRRREDHMVEIRKNKREENLLKKRREGLQMSQPFADAIPVNNIERKVRIFCSLCMRRWFFILFYFNISLNLVIGELEIWGSKFRDIMYLSFI